LSVHDFLIIEDETVMSSNLDFLQALG